MRSKYFSLLVIIPLLCNVLNAQHSNPELLKGPADWTFEKFALPPVFAPAFPFHGFEELRFAPGMFTKNASDYFTYVFAASLDSQKTFTKADLSNYLDVYFKGLCFATARDRKLTVDTSLIKVTIESQKKATAPHIAYYTAVVALFGVFADGAPVTLNLDIKTTADKSASKVYLLIAASPHPKTDDIWKQLYQIRDAAR